MTRILVVEDDRDIAELITRYLQKAGFTTEFFRRGATRWRHSPNGHPTC